MKRIQETMPVFFTRQLFDHLGLSLTERMHAQPRIEYLNLTKEQIECMTLGQVSRTGVFKDVLRYIQFDQPFGSLLCVFDDRERCYRAYFFKDIFFD